MLLLGSRQNAGEIFTRFTQSRGFSWYCRELLRPPPITGTRRHGLFLHQVDSARVLSVLYVVFILSRWSVGEQQNPDKYSV